MRISDLSSDVCSSDLFDEALKLNTKFHDVIIQSSGNEHLARLADVIHKMILFNRLNLLKFSLGKENIKKGYYDHLLSGIVYHQNILACMSARDEVKAEATMRNHTIRTLDSMISLFELDRNSVV